VYPSQAEMLDATEEYLFNQHEGYFSQFDKESWTVMYERHYYRNVSLIIYGILRNITRIFTEFYEILCVYLWNLTKYYAYIIKI
jgi:hypothetical protein